MIFPSLAANDAPNHWSVLLSKEVPTRTLASPWKSRVVREMLSRRNVVLPSRRNWTRWQWSSDWNSHFHTAPRLAIRSCGEWSRGAPTSKLQGHMVFSTFDKENLWPESMHCQWVTEIGGWSGWMRDELFWSKVSPMFDSLIIEWVQWRDEWWEEKNKQ